MCGFKLLLVHEGRPIRVVLGAEFTLGIVETLWFKSMCLIYIMSYSIKIPRNFVQFMFMLVRPKYVLKLIL